MKILKFTWLFLCKKVNVLMSRREALLSEKNFLEFSDSLKLFQTNLKANEYN